MGKATCRYCGKVLKGFPYYTGKQAYIPDTEKPAKVNFYGGWVCSYNCDYNACIDMKSSMPGAGRAKSLSSAEMNRINDNWN